MSPSSSTSSLSSLPSLGNKRYRDQELTLHSVNSGKPTIGANRSLSTLPSAHSRKRTGRGSGVNPSLSSRPSCLGNKLRGQRGRVGICPLASSKGQASNVSAFCLQATARPLSLSNTRHCCRHVGGSKERIFDPSGSQGSLSRSRIPLGPMVKSIAGSMIALDLTTKNRLDLGSDRVCLWNMCTF